MRIQLDLEFADPDEFQAFVDIIKGNNVVLGQLAEKLKGPTDGLQAILNTMQPQQSSGVDPMGNLAQTNPQLEQLRSQVEKTNGVLQSATTFITGIPQLIQTAVDQAMANGATQQELQPVIDLGTTMAQNADALAAAVAANQPTPVSPPGG